MTAVWALDLPPSEKFVLLALADNANDDGTCWPSVATICSKTSLAERTVRGIIHKLQQLGQLAISERYGRSNVFTVTPASAAPLQNLHPAPDAPPPLQYVQGTPAAIAPTPAVRAPRIIKEPSTEPSVESSTDAHLEFLDFKITYPARSGDQGWINAQRFWNRNIERGYTAQQMVDGAKRYSLYLAATGGDGTQYVKKASTFLDPHEHLFLDDYKPPATKAEKRLDTNIDSMKQFLAEGAST